jgi:hypothetical protein
MNALSPCWLSHLGRISKFPGCRRHIVLFTFRCPARGRAWLLVRLKEVPAPRTRHPCSRAGPAPQARTSWVATCVA